MRYPKYYTVKEWKKFNRIADYVPDDPSTNRPYRFYNFITKRHESYDFMTLQEIMINKHDIILTDYKPSPLMSYRDLPKKELAVKILKNFNMKNFDKGMKVFDQGLKGFTDSIDAVTSQLGSGQTRLKTTKQNKVKLWSDKKRTSHPSIKIWSDPPKKKKRKYRHKPVQDRHKQNLNAIWGKK